MSNKTRIISFSHETEIAERTKQFEFVADDAEDALALLRAKLPQFGLRPEDIYNVRIAGNWGAWHKLSDRALTIGGIK